MHGDRSSRAQAKGIKVEQRATSDGRKLVRARGAACGPDELCVLVTVRTTKAAEPGEPAGRLVNVADVKAAIGAVLRALRERREMRSAAARKEASRG